MASGPHGGETLWGGCDAAQSPHWHAQPGLCGAARTPLPRAPEYLCWKMTCTPLAWATERESEARGADGSVWVSGQPEECHARGAGEGVRHRNLSPIVSPFRRPEVQNPGVSGSTPSEALGDGPFCPPATLCCCCPRPPSLVDASLQSRPPASLTPASQPLASRLCLSPLIRTLVVGFKAHSPLGCPPLQIPISSKVPFVGTRG